MEIVQKSREQAAILELKGALDYCNGDRELEKAIDDLGKRGCTKLVINLGGVFHIDTACLGLIIAAYVRFRRRGGGVTLLQTPPRIRYLLRITRLDEVLLTFATEEEAVRALASTEARDQSLVATTDSGHAAESVGLPRRPA